MAEEAGRDPSTLEVTIFGPNADERTLRALSEAGVTRVIFALPPEPIEKLLPLLDERRLLAESVG